MIKAGIVGGAGYTAGELIRILCGHTEVELKYVQSASHLGEKISKVHKDLLYLELSFTDVDLQDIDILFLCMGHGESTDFVKNTKIPASVRIIDLGNDFRLQDNTEGFIYGLPELSRSSLIGSRRIANPGCFATAIELGLLPLAARNELPKELTVFGVTGATGAGQKPTEDTHFSNRNNNLSNYKVFTHQHLREINETLHKAGDQSMKQLDEKFPFDLAFVPVRGCHARGILINTVIRTSKSKTELVDIYKSYYQEHPFVVVSDEPLFMKQVVNTNYCFIHICNDGNRILITSVIDNLLKGASGQAVQNMNLMFGIAETTGLRLKANYF
ncbi:N-acetyl-gamma-glutamyl-phosphate reductase [Bacteroidia bacterium]|nr:N-acetyl-gamma-glutamyl-phosphate reductase [Bacteroidia bacterium]